MKATKTTDNIWNEYFVFIYAFYIVRIVEVVELAICNLKSNCIGLDEISPNYYHCAYIPRVVGSKQIVMKSEFFTQSKAIFFQIDLFHLII